MLDNVRAGLWQLQAAASTAKWSAGVQPGALLENQITMVPMKGRTRRQLMLEGTAIALVALSAVISLVLSRRELTQVPYLNDAAMHEEMVRFALAKLRTGHLPLDSWFPFLNLGSPQYLHYQSIASMLTALLGWAIGVGRAFTLTTWLLVSAWPLCIYAAARIFGLSRGVALAAAMLAPFVSSWTGIGYEQVSYFWIGFGVWSQLWAMWMLPLAWAFSYRAVNEGRYVFCATSAIAATAALHFETGYLAFFGVLVALVMQPSEVKRRCIRALVIMAGAAAALAWVIVPLISQGKWASVNQFLQHGPSGVDANSYGATVVLHQLVTGGLFDWHHLDLITPLIGIGLVAVVVDVVNAVRSMSSITLEQRTARFVAVLFVGTLVLFFGRPTLGALVDVVPGAKNLFLRRFIVGAQLSGLMLAGVGAARSAMWVQAFTRRLLAGFEFAEVNAARHLADAVVIVAAIAAAVPAWIFISTQASADSTLIARQAGATVAVREVGALMTRVAADGGGRVFAGDPTDWGATFRVGLVPVFKYLAAIEVDEVGLTLRTASLMSDPEVNFDEANPADYAAFGIRWLLLPVAMRPSVRATLIETRGEYALWQIATNGYLDVVDTSGSIASTTSDLGSSSMAFLSKLSTPPVFPTVAYEGQPAARATLLSQSAPSEAPGKVVMQLADLQNGTARAEVLLRRRAVVLLSVSFDPGWQARVDGHVAQTEMIAPALVGVAVGAGRHDVQFIYRGFPDYPQLIGIALSGLGAVALLGRRWKKSS